MKVETNAFNDIVYTDDNDELHRDDGPAFIYSDGELQWWHHGQLHCRTGPAVITRTGIKEFWVYGKQVSEQEFNFFFKQNEYRG